MASGIANLRKIQIGEETTAKGTPAAATAVLLGELTMKETPTIVRPAEERANLAQHTRSHKVANMAELQFKGEVTFEQLLYFLHMGILGDVTPVAGPSNKIWTFTPSLVAAGTYDSFTIEDGDDVQAWETEYCMASKIVITGGMNEPLQVTVDIFGRKMTQTSFTGSLSAPTVESVITQMGRIYIDDEDGVIGTTVKSSTLISFTLTINTGLSPVRHADGSLDFSTYQEGPKSVELQMTLAFNSGVETEHTYYNGETLRLVRLEFQGDDVTTHVDSTDTVQDDPLSDSATTLNVSDGGNFEVGETIKIEDEYLRITAINTNTLTVIRGVYGTTAASHVQTTAIYEENDKRLTLDICGIYTDFASLGERDGEDVIDCVLSSQLGANYTGLFEVVVVNAVASLP